MFKMVKPKRIDMKKLFTILAAMLTYAGVASAQQVAGTNTNDNTNTAVTTATTSSSDESCYCCPKGDFCSNKPGTCALHVNLNLVKDGEYYCTMEDNVTSDNAGTCPLSGKEMKQMKGKCSAMNSSDNNENKDSKNKDKKNNNQDSEPNNSGK